MLDESEPLRIAIYIRVSTDEQAKGGYSLDAQLKHLRNYVAMRQNWTIVKEYIEDGYSGRNTKRPQYQQMMAEMDQWDGMLVIKMDRIHRNRNNMMDMLVFLEEKGKKFISVGQSLDTSNAMGRFVASIIAGIAQLESEQTGERVQIGMTQKQEDPEANAILGKVPFGYRVDKSNPDPKKHKILEIPKEIPVVKKIFKLYDQGLFTSQIARKLGIHPRTGKPWNRDSVLYILHNPFYADRFLWDGKIKPVGIDPLITKEFYNEIQDKIYKNTDCKGKLKPFHLPLDKDIFKLDKKTLKSLPYRLKPQKRPIL